MAYASFLAVWLPSSLILGAVHGPGALLHWAAGDQLVSVFVDHGLLRLGEGDQVMETFDRHMGVQVIRVNAEARSLDALKGEADCPRRRDIAAIPASLPWQ